MGIDENMLEASEESCGITEASSSRADFRARGFGKGDGRDSRDLEHWGEEIPGKVYF